MAKKRTLSMILRLVSVLVVAAVGIMLWLAPYVFFETMAWTEPHAIVSPKPAPLAQGRMADKYWAVERLNAGTFAIGEPHYYQRNYSYLIVGNREALLFDAGSGTRAIGPVVRSLTSLPVTVLPSHLHYDHVGGIGEFRSVAMIDVPETRADVRDGIFTPGRYEFLGAIDHLGPPRFRVTRWVRPGTWIDLGGRKLRLIATPGHTPTSASLYDPGFRQFFAGDYLYPGPLYAQLPGASRSAYASTAMALLATLPQGTTIWSAHCCRSDSGIRAPQLGVGDVAALRTALAQFDAGRLKVHGFYPRVFRVNAQLEFLTSFPWNNR